MSFLFYCSWHNKNEWLKEIKKKFKEQKIFLIKDKPDFSKIEYAIIWNLPDKILKQLKNNQQYFNSLVLLNYKLQNQNNQTILT